MTTKEFLQRQIRLTELDLQRAERKPNVPDVELMGLREKRHHLQKALEAVEEHWRRVHQERGWSDKGTAADVRPVVRGQWIEKRGPKFGEDGHFKLHGEYGVIGFVCSVCGRFEKEREPFCNCGADMRGGEEK